MSFACLLFSLSSTALATDITTTSVLASTTTFIDGDGKENTVEITILQPGHSYVEYYIEGILTNTVDTTITEEDQVIIEVTDTAAGITYLSSEAVSNHITNVETLTTHIPSARSSTYLGRITYNTFYDNYDTYRAYYLDVYKELIKNTQDYKTLNTEAGFLAATAVSMLAAALSIICPALAAIAQDLLGAIVYSAGTSIVGGIIQGAITKTYYADIMYYDVTTIYPPLSRERTFEGEQYRVLLPGNVYSSDYYYDGFLLWNDNAVARVFYENSFGTSYYPGVKSYT